MTPRRNAIHSILAVHELANLRAEVAGLYCRSFLQRAAFIEPPPLQATAGQVAELADALG